MPINRTPVPRLHNKLRMPQDTGGPNLEFGETSVGKVGCPGVVQEDNLLFVRSLLFAKFYWSDW